MAFYSRFFGGPEGEEPEYTQVQFAEVLSEIFTNGVFSGVLNKLEVVENDPLSMSVILKSGKGWINGYWCHNTENLVKTIGASDPGLDRIDRIILRLDTVENLEISVEVLEGTPAAEPTPPDLTQNASTWEISLIQVLVGAGVTSVSNANITDEREYVIGIITRPPKTYTPDPAETATLNLLSGREHRIIMPAGNITIAISNEKDGQKFIISILQDAVGSRTVTWFDTIKWADGSAPTLTTTANKRDCFGFIVTGVDTYDGFVIGQNI
ncbi:hypothetical protein ES705_29963 [subsurface metagenome]